LLEVGTEDRGATVSLARRGALIDALAAAGRFTDAVEGLEADRRRSRRLAEAAWQAERTTLAEELARAPVGVATHATVLLDLTDEAQVAGQAERLAHAAAIDLASRAGVHDAEGAVRTAAAGAGAIDDAGLATLLLATGPEPPRWATEAFGSEAVAAFAEGLVEALEIPETKDAPHVPPTLRAALLEARRVAG
jgi:hypothetical protein